MSHFLDAEGYGSEDEEEARKKLERLRVEDALRQRAEIRVVSQALCFRAPNALQDAGAVCRLLNEAYAGEVTGPGAFRRGACVQEDTVRELFGTHEWILMDAANGRGVEQDGTILGAACFTKDGESRRNGRKEGRLGSIRFLGILDRYRGLVAGRRLLRKVEQAMADDGCVRCMACVPSTRGAVAAWLGRRGYEDVGRSFLYPAAHLGHDLTRTDVELKAYVKPLGDEYSAPVHAAQEGRIDEALERLLAEEAAADMDSVD